MSILPDHSIRDLCAYRKYPLTVDPLLVGHYPQLIQPFSESQLQPASYDLRLSNQFRVPTNREGIIDPYQGQETDLVVFDLKDPHPPNLFILHPGEFVLASTVERFIFPNYLAGQIGGKSSLGRLGLQIHATAGFFDPGFQGTATLELSNVARQPIKLYPGMLIAQMIFMELKSAPTHVYGDSALNSKYTNQEGPTPSLYHNNPRTTP